MVLFTALPLLCSVRPARRSRDPLRRKNAAKFSTILHRTELIMAKKKDDTEAAPEAVLENGEDTAPAIGMITQYVKDFSFENPNAPAVFQWQAQPQIEVQFNIGADPVGDDVHEVVLKIDVKAVSGNQTAFQVELSYAGLFGIRNLPDEQMQPFLFAEAPRILFPFARRVLADAVRDGGFQPLLLEPIDFGALYMQQAQLAASDGESAGAAGNA
jgi:preprotein translocase subunit SecB